MKTKLGAIPYLYPIPMVLCGANVDQKANFLTLGDCGLMGIRPALIYVSLHNKHYTTAGILANGTFSVNIPSVDLLKEVQYCGNNSGRDADKSKLFDVFYGETGTAPLITQCPVNIECKVIQEFSIQHRHIFIGEVIQTFIDENLYVSKDGEKKVADLLALNPIMYALDDQFYQVGQIIKPEE